MCNKRFRIWSLFFLLFLPVENNAQDVAVMLHEAKQLQAAFKDNEALNKYLEILRHQPANEEALCKVSELYSILGKRQISKEKQRQYYNNAKAYAQKALQQNPNSSDAHFVMAVAMGRIALISSGEDKIKAVRDIKSYAEKSIRLDPSNFKGYHVLGKWHYEVSNLSSVEKWLVKVAFGELPAASLDDAVRNYEKSKHLNPAFLLNYLEMAKAWRRKDNDSKAIELLEAMLKLPNISSDDATVKSEAQKLLEDLK